MISPDNYLRSPVFCGTPTPSQVMNTYSEHRKALINYLLAKVEQADWHGVSDAANDLRVLEAQQETVGRQD